MIAIPRLVVLLYPVSLPVCLGVNVTVDVKVLKLSKFVNRINADFV